MELKSKFAVGKYVCEMSFSRDKGRLDVAWSPDVPARGSLKGFIWWIARGSAPNPDSLP
jgi:hypothetical protein